MISRTMWVSLCAVVAVTTGCGSAAEKGLAAGADGTADAGADSGDSATGVGADSGAEDAGGLLPAVWWRLGASIEIVDGQVSEEQTTLLLESLDEDRQIRCTAEAPVERMTLLGPPEPEIFVWWQVVPGAWSGDCVDLGEVVSVAGFQLGIGELHPELRAVIGSVEEAEPGSEESLNGAFARIETGADVYVFGLAGVEAAYRGEGDPAVDAVLSDGTWLVQPVYSFSIREGW